MASIKNITSFIVSVLLEDGTMKEVEVQHIVNLTMIDGKIQILFPQQPTLTKMFSVWCVSN